MAEITANPNLLDRDFCEVLELVAIKRAKEVESHKHFKKQQAAQKERRQHAKR